MDILKTFTYIDLFLLCTKFSEASVHQLHQSYNVKMFVTACTTLEARVLSFLIFNKRYVEEHKRERAVSFR